MRSDYGMMMSIDHFFRTVMICLSLLSAKSVWAAEAAEFEQAVAKMETAVRQELERGDISGVSIALVDDDQIVYAQGFGFSDTDSRVLATPQTVYRAGSISKLFTAVAAMRLGELEPLDLDAPLEVYNPDFRIRNPYEGTPPITLRQLMCHRSGMVREAPIGGYFDDREPTLDQTLASLSDCVLASPPNAKTRYSNVGPSIVGQTIEKVSGETFAAFTQKHIFDVVGMSSSSWALREPLTGKMSAGYMRVAQPDGTFKRIRAPQFELGTVPAGNLYTTVEDLGRFITFLVNEGSSGSNTLLKPATLAELFRPQGSNDNRTFGLGFGLGKFREEGTVFHMGAVYGFTSSLVAIPSQKIGAVVLANEDIAIGSVQRLMAAALDAVSSRRETLREREVSAPAPVVSTEAAEIPLEQFAGEYESIGLWAEFTTKDGTLHAVISGQPMTLRPLGPLSFLANGRFVHESPITFERDEHGKITGCSALKQKFTRLDPVKKAEAPEAWSKFVGSYGPAFIPLIVSIRHGHLYAMTENEMDYRLTPMNRFVFRLPPGLYDDEQLIFQEDADGIVHSVIMANFPLKRSGH